MFLSESVRKYGTAPYRIVVVHGGPGAPGSLAPVARRLAQKWGTLEPLQTKDTINGQVKELKLCLEEYAALPIVLIGHSWGAFLSFILAASHQRLLKKLILVGSGPFESTYAKNIMQSRLQRLSLADQQKVKYLLQRLNQHGSNMNSLLQEFGQLMTKADSYHPLIEVNEDIIEVQADINEKIWNQAEQLRSDGSLLKMGRLIRCPVVAIHGEYDPHPLEGINEPLSRVLEDFHLIKLEKCGHYPWIEKYAQTKFFDVLQHEIPFPI